MPDYRTNPFDNPDAGVSASTASRYRTVVADIVSNAHTRVEKRKFAPWVSPSRLSMSQSSQKDRYGRNRIPTPNEAGKELLGLALWAFPEAQVLDKMAKFRRVKQIKKVPFLRGKIPDGVRTLNRRVRKVGKFIRWIDRVM